MTYTADPAWGVTVDADNTIFVGLATTNTNKQSGGNRRVAE